MPKHPCPLCQDFNSNIGGSNITILRRDGLVVLADFAPLSVGHVLVCPEEHITSFANADSRMRSRAFDLVNQIVEKLRLAGYQSVVGEHGTGKMGGPSNACLDHAHLHVVPFETAIPESTLLNFYKRHGGDAILLKNDAELERFKHEPYNILKFRSGPIHVWPGLDGFFPQFFRRAICEILNFPSNDKRITWQLALDKEVAAKTAILLSPMLKKNGAKEISSVRTVNKLVRDRIPEIIIENGGFPVFRYIEGHELHRETVRKVEEELKEFINRPSLEEGCDLFDITNFLLAQHGFNFNQEASILDKKKTISGGFENGIFLELVLH